MKKNKVQDQEQKGKPRRLSLNRETIKVLNNPALLELARGGLSRFDGCGPATSATASDPC
jgi:hypothetical protein